MNMKSVSGSNLSLDSLEVDFRRQYGDKETVENVDTILVPFYENDVLIKIPKGPKKPNIKQSNCKKFENFNQEVNIPRSYLVNKERKSRKGSYLEIFRKQFILNRNPKKCNFDNEIRSLSPEYGDTERESINETNGSPGKDFYNTEAYNEMYYEKVMNQEISQYLENNFEQALHFTEDLRSKSPDEMNLRSVSETSNRPRLARRATIEPTQNIYLGGLGPDIENIRPRLERAKSLQRYSEKVRMENRLKIYKKTVEADHERKSRETSARLRSAPKLRQGPIQNNSYLVNKLYTDNSPLGNCTKSGMHKKKVQKCVKDNTKRNENVVVRHSTHTNKGDSKAKKDIEPIKNDFSKKRIKSGTKTKDINQSKQVSPPQINFLFSQLKVRPSTALRTLEEKHRMYQEKVRAFEMEHNSYNS